MMMRHVPMAIASCICFLALLGGNVTAQNKTTQPNAQRWPALGRFVAIEGSEVTIGVENDPGPYLFGEITAVASDNLGTVYVLDRSAHQVRSFDEAGKFIDAFGRAGRGPADLGWPLAMFHDGKSRLFVVDRLNGVVVFETDKGRLKYLTSFGSNYQPTNACILGGQIIMPGWREKKILHVFSASGQHVRSFGESFSSDTNAAVREVFSQIPLRVFCDEELQRVYVTPSAAGLARAYDVSGRLLWQSPLPEFNGHQVMLTAQGITTFYGTFATSSVLKVGNDYVVIQAREREAVKSNIASPGGGRGTWQDKGVVTYALSARTGQLLTRDTNAPLIGFATRNKALAYTQEPFPRIWRVRLTAR